MPIRALERVREVLGTVAANVDEAVASAPIGFINDSLRSVLPRHRHSMNVVLLGGFHTDYQDKDEAARVGEDTFDSLIGSTALKDSDVLFIEALNFLDDGVPTERERESVSTTAKLLKEVGQKRLEGVVTTNSVDVIHRQLEPVVFEGYLPRAEKKILQAGHSQAPVVTYLGVLPVSRIGQGFGLNPTHMLDGGIAERTGKDASWQQVSIGGRLGLLR